MKRARYQRGTVDADPRTRKLYFRWYEKSGKRRAEYVGDFSSPKRLVEAATEAIRDRINAGESEQTARVSSLVERCKREKMSERFSTSRSEQSRLRNHILPKWGDVPICEVRPREITTCLVGPRTLQQLEVTLRRLSLSFRLSSSLS